MRSDSITSHTSTMGVYTRDELLHYRESTYNQRLPQPVWRTIVSLGINKTKFRPTRRGVKAGLKFKQKQRAYHNKQTINPSLLKVCHWNARSIRNKTTTCTELILDHKVDIMFLTETWLSVDSDQVAIGELTLSGYNFINVPRRTDNHGGIGVLYRSELKLQILPTDFVAETFEYTIIYDKERKIHFVIIYRPPPSTENKLKTSSFLSEFDEFLLYVNTLSGSLLMLGDYNVHVNKPERTEVRHYLSSIEGTGLTQHVTDPTHRSGNTLDHVITRANEMLLKDHFVGLRLSDHNVIHCTLNVNKPATQKQVIISRKMRDINPVSFQTDFHAKLLDTFPNDVNTSVNMFEEAVITTLDIHAPATKRSCSNRIRQPWYNQDIHMARRVRRMLEKKWRKTRLEIDHQAFLSQNSLVNTMIENSKKAYLLENLKDADAKSTFKTVNGLLNNNNKILPTHDSTQELCGDFAMYFKDKIDNIQKGLQSKRDGLGRDYTLYNQHTCVPKLYNFPLLSEENVCKLIKGFASKSCLLDCIPTWFVKCNLDIFVPAVTKIINASMSTGVFPDSLKHAIISPIIKKPSLDPNTLKNYRPVSNIKFLSKLMERHAVNTINNHMSELNLGESLQSAYKAGHSTETALIKVQNDIMTSLHNRKGVFLVLLDLSAAFDTVTHNILFDRFENEIGLSGTALNWLRSYFTGRTTSININGVQSAKQVLNYGLPQGSIVGPLSFTVYTIPIGRIIRGHGLSYHLYADDVQLYVSFDPLSNISRESALSKLSECIYDIEKWMTTNMLQLNNEKTEFFVALSTHHQRLMPGVKLKVGNSLIEPSNVIRNLGVMFDTQMTMSAQVASLSRSITFHLRNISRIRRYLDFDTCNSVVRSLIISRLDYGNILLMGSNTTGINRLQRLQNWAAKLIFQAAKRDHASPLIQATSLAAC